MIELAPSETLIGAKVTDISQGGLGIETVRPIVLSDPFTAKLMAAPSWGPVLRIEGKPIWQQPFNGGQRWGAALLQPKQFPSSFIEGLADEAVRGGSRMITFTLEATQANQVCIAGDFNNWDTQGLPLEKIASGVWQITLLLFPGRYEYQFYVDGQWHNDPTSAKRTPNLYGTENDVIEVPVS